MGLGGINSWGAEPLDAYRLNANREYSHKFRIAPVRKQLNDPTEYSLLGFKNFGWNDLPAEPYGQKEIEAIYENQPDTDVTVAVRETQPLVFRIPEMESSYSVFDMQGRFVAKFITQGVEDLHMLTKRNVKHAGTYLVRSKAGRTFRISVK